MEVVGLEVEAIGSEVAGSEHASLEAVGLTVISSEVVGLYCTFSSYLAFVILLLHLCRHHW